MPYKIRKKGRCYRGSTPRGVKAKCTTKKKALSQKRLINAIEHSDWIPTGIGRKY